MTQQDLKKYLDGLARKGQQLSPQLIKVGFILFGFRRIVDRPVRHTVNRLLLRRNSFRSCCGVLARG